MNEFNRSVIKSLTYDLSQEGLNQNNYWLANVTLLQTLPNVHQVRDGFTMPYLEVLAQYQFAGQNGTLDFFFQLYWIASLEYKLGKDNQRRLLILPIQTEFSRQLENGLLVSEDSFEIPSFDWRIYQILEDLHKQPNWEDWLSFVPTLDFINNHERCAGVPGNITVSDIVGYKP